MASGLATANQKTTHATPGEVEALGATTSVRNGVQLKAHPDNDGPVYVGFTDDVTTSTGFPLSANEPLFISPESCDRDIANIYLVSDFDSQVIAYINM